MNTIGYWAIIGLSFFVVHILNLETIGLSVTVGAGLFMAVLLFDYSYVRIEIGIFLLLLSGIILIIGFYVGTRYGFTFNQLLYFDKSLPWSVEKLIYGFYSLITCAVGLIFYNIIENIILNIKGKNGDNL